MKDIRMSYFVNHKQTVPERDITLSQLLKGIKHPHEKTIKAIEQVREYESKGDEDSKKQAKSILPCVTLSGIFSKRNSDGIISLTGLLQIDLDAKDNPNLDVEKKRQLYSMFECVVAVFRSPSGNGIKAIVAVDYNHKQDHDDAFYTVEKFLEENTGDTNDKNVKDITRLMYISHDPDIYIRTEPVIPLKLQRRPVESHVHYPVKNSNTEEITPDMLLEYINADCDRDTWLKVGMALKSCGESIETWKAWSMTAPSRYKKGSCEASWKGFKGVHTIGTLVWYARQNGFKHPEASDLWKSMREEEVFELATQPADSTITKLGCKSGFYSFDSFLVGLREGWLIVLKGAKGQGKTTFVQQLALTQISSGRKTFLMLGESSKPEVMNGFSLQSGGQQHEQKFLHRVIVDATDRSVINFAEKYKNMLTLFTVEDVNTWVKKGCVFHSVKQEMFEAYNKGARIYIIDNLKRLCLGYSNVQRNELETEIVFFLKTFAHMTGTTVILLAHKGRMHDSTAGSAETEEICDCIAHFKLVPRDNTKREKEISKCPFSEDVKKKITATCEIEKVRKHGIHDTVYFNWDPVLGVCKDICQHLPVDEYSEKDFLHWTEFIPRYSVEDVPNYDKQFSAK